MAHAYTPGLRVTENTVVRRERRLPLKGEVLVQKGQAVLAKTIVARTMLPGNVQTVNLASALSIEAHEVQARPRRRPQPIHRLDVPAEQVIERDHRVPVPQQPLNRVRPDIARPARD